MLQPIVHPSDSRKQQRTAAAQDATATTSAFVHRDFSGTSGSNSGAPRCRRGTCLRKEASLYFDMALATTIKKTNPAQYIIMILLGKHLCNVIISCDGSIIQCNRHMSGPGRNRGSLCNGFMRRQTRKPMYIGARRGMANPFFGLKDAA